MLRLTSSRTLKQTTDLNNLPQTHATPSNFSFDNNSEEVFPSTPCLNKLRDKLQKHAKYEPKPPLLPFNTKTLSKTEELSLQHYVAWQCSGGTVNAYNLHARVLENATDTPILSLYKVECLAESITQLHPEKVNMCLKSCIAYTGDYADLQTCPYGSSATKEECKLP
jgi:hypothetical protein